MMFNLLLEDIKNVENIIDYLNSIVTKLRISNKLNENPKLFNYIKNYYDEVINKFYDYYIVQNNKLDPKIEEEIIDGIIDFIGKIKNI